MHLSQPLDRSCFGPLKTAWRQAFHQYMANNPGKVVIRYSFSPLFNEAWTSSMTQANIVSGFKVTGIYPFDRSALCDEPDCVESHLTYLPLLTPSRRHSTRVMILQHNRMMQIHFMHHQQVCWSYQEDLACQKYYNFQLYQK